jgi:hypothetical protein
MIAEIGMAVLLIPVPVGNTYLISIAVVRRERNAKLIFFTYVKLIA